MIDRLLTCLRSHRFPVTAEAKTQEAIEQALIAAGIEHKREFRLSDQDRVDFMVGSIAAEVKVRGSAREIFRQLERYAQHDAVTEIVLVSNKAMGLPAVIGGKPAYFVNLARAWM